MAASIPASFIAMNAFFYIDRLLWSILGLPTCWFWVPSLSLLSFNLRWCLSFILVVILHASVRMVTKRPSLCCPRKSAKKTLAFGGTVGTAVRPVEAESPAWV